MKVLIAGPASVHLSNYCRAIKLHINQLIFLSETPFNIPEATKSYIVSFRGINIFRLLSNIKRLQKVIAEEMPDVIHVHQINRLAYFIYRAMNGTNIPLVTTAWGSDVLLVPQKNIIYRNMIASVIKYSSVVTADALIMIEAMKKLDTSNSKYIWLQYGIYPIIPSIKEKIIYSNRLHKPLYNIDIIIRDFAAFSAKKSEWMLYVAGEGSETPKLKSLANELKLSDKIKFLGWVDKETNNKNYSIASIYVSIASSDGTSVSLLEAMSANCIPIVSDIPVTKEWINDGINGIIRKPNINPFEEALKLDRDKCFSINSQKIISSASRQQSTLRFFEIYKQSISDN